MSTEATADQQPSQPVAVLSSEGLGLEPERAAFERWLNPGQHAGNVSPWMKPGRYEKAEHQLAWLAWRAAVATERERWNALAQEIDYGINHGWPQESLTRLQGMRAAMLARRPNVRAERPQTAEPQPE